MSIFELFEWCMVLFPILNIYLTPISAISIGEAAILSLGILIIVQKRKLRVNKRLAVFYAYILLVTAVFVFPNIQQIGQNGISALLSYALYAVFLLLYFNIGQIRSFCTKYLVVARVICVLTLIQFALSKVGVRIPLVIPGSHNIVGSSLAQLLYIQTMSGPFTEPAHFAQYVSVALILVLIQKRISLRDVVLFAVSMALTMKGTAISQLAVIFCVFCLRDLYTRNAKKVVRVIFLTMGCIVAIAVLFATVDAVRIMFSRVYEIVGQGDRSMTGYYGVSGYFRVKYGFDFFVSLDTLHKILGIGVGAFGQYDGLSVVPHSIRYLQETTALQDFRSGFTMLLVDSGLIGVAIYLYAVFKDRTPNQRFFAMSLIALQCTSADMNIPSWLILMYLVFNYSDEISVEREVMTI